MGSRQSKQQEQKKRYDPVRSGTIWTIGRQKEWNRKNWKSSTTELDQKVSIAYNVGNRYNIYNLPDYISFTALESLRNYKYGKLNRALKLIVMLIGKTPTVNHLFLEDIT